MADKKISQLTAASTPLAGTEVLPIVQSGATVKVASDDLTVKNVRANATTGLLQVTGPGAATTRVMTVPNANFTVARTDAANSFTGDQTLSTGNLVVGTAGKGVDFSNTSGLGTRKLLSDYETGDYTATITPATSGSLTLSGSWDSLNYTKIGWQVTVQGMILVGSVSSPVGSSVAISLPFVNSSSGKGRSRVSGTTFFLADPPGTTYTRHDTFIMEGQSSLTVNIDASTITASDQLFVNFTYFTS